MAARSERPPERNPGSILTAALRAILADARRAADHPHDAEAVHQFRKAMKRWRALLRLLKSECGNDLRRWRLAARSLAHELSTARDSQAALEALDDLSAAKHTQLSPRALRAIKDRLAASKEMAEATVSADVRSRLATFAERAGDAIRTWPIERIGFDAIARGLTQDYARAQKACPRDWHTAKPKALHRLRQRVVIHRYQMELLLGAWPRLGRLWISEAQRLRERLGAVQDLAVLAKLTEPKQPLARWHAELTAQIEARRRTHVRAASRLAARIFAERPKDFRRRITSLQANAERTL